jgi:hypothetical protein
MNADELKAMAVFSDPLGRISMKRNNSAHEF